MKFQRFLFVPLAVLLGITLLPSCSKDPKVVAAEMLKERNYSNKVEDFLMAASTGDLEALDLFATLGMDINAVGPKGSTALHRAVSAGRVEIVRHLLERGANPDIADQSGRIPLVQAADSGSSDLVKLLLPVTKTPERKDNEGWGALTIAAFNAHSKTVKMLAPKLRNQLDDGLLVACFRGDVSTMEEILKNGAYINTRSPAGETPLMIAAENGHLGAIKLLLKNKANPYAVDETEQTAANLADKSGHAEIRDLLLSPSLIAAAVEGEETGADEMPFMETATTATVPSVDAAQPAAKLIVPTLRAMPAGSDEDEPVSAKADATKPAVPAVATKSATSAAMMAANPPTSGKNGKISSAVAAPPAFQAEPVWSPRSVPNSSRRTVRPLNGIVLDAKSTQKATASSSNSSPVAPQVTRSAPGVYTAKIDPPGVATLADVSGTSEAPQETRLTGMVLEGYHERSLPIILKGVNQDGDAEFRILSSADDAPVRVKKGDQIPGTPFRVTEATHRTTTGKMGKGELIDVSRATVVDVDAGATYDLVKDIPGQSGSTYAIIRTSGTEDRYLVKPHDRFTSSLTGEADEFEVIDVRPTQVIIRQQSSQNVITIDREGMVMR